MCSISRLNTQLATPVHFCGEYTSVLTPFAVSADKDTVKHRAKQVLGLKLADFSTPNPKLVDLVCLPKFIQFMYFSHPSAIDVTGSGLASLIFSELEKCGTTVSSMKNFVGLCGDGQYLNNNVLQNIEEQNCLEGLFNL